MTFRFNTMKVKIKKLHEFAVTPKYAIDGDACFDLHAATYHIDEMGNHVYGTGLAFEIPEGYVGLLFPRSSNSNKDLILMNSVGIIDSGYRGEVSFKYRMKWLHDLTRKNAKDITILKTYSIYDRIGQMMIIPYPKIEFEEVDELSESKRGHGGYGSTGK